MARKFSNTHAKTVKEVLTEYSQIVVPNFQRNYSWETGGTKAQVSELWNDVLSKWIESRSSQRSSDKEYLLGPVIFIESDEENLEIVDGQQRISTLTMLLAIARDLCFEAYLDTKNNDYAPEKEHRNMIEKRDLVPPDKYTHLNWRLKMNSVDEELFEEMVQKYESEQSDPFAIDGEEYRRISRKYRYYKKKLKDKNNDYRDSEIKLIQAYLYLYEQLSDSLTTNFYQIENSESVLNQIKKSSESETDAEIRENPKNYGLPVDFFDDKLEGLDVYENNSWDEETRKDIDARYQYDCNKSRSKNKKSFDEWVDEKIEAIKEKEFSAGNFLTIRNNLIEKKIDENSKKRKLEHVPYLKNFVDDLIGNSLSNVRIIVEQDEDAFQIFETTNARGESLSKTNLVKNLLLRQIKDEKLTQKLSNEWDEIINSVGDADSFLYDSVRSRGYSEDGKNYSFTNYPIQHVSGKVKVTKGNLFKIIKYPITKIEDDDGYPNATNSKSKEEKSKQHCADYIKKILKEDAQISNLLSDPKKFFNPVDDIKINQNRDPLPALIDLFDLKAEYPRLPIMTAFRKWGEDSDEFIILVKFLACFFFRYKTIRDKKATKLESMMLTVCETIQNGNNPKFDLEKILKFLVLEDDESDFHEKFNEYKAGIQHDVAKFILKHISHYLGNDYDDVKEIDKLDLEHILPTNPKMDSKKPSESWDKKDFFSTFDPEYPEAQNLERWSKKLGNLTLLKGVVNRKLQNLNFPMKLKMIDKNSKPPVEIGYNYSGLEINKKTVVIDQETGKPRTDWTVSSIYERGIYFSKLAQNIWALPKLACSDEKCNNHHHPKKISAGIKISKINDEECPICQKKSLFLKFPEQGTSGKEYQLPKDYSF